MILKLLKYNLNCIKDCSNSNTIDLKKSFILKIGNKTEFKPEEDILNLKVKSELNKNSMNLLYSPLLLETNKIYAPVLFANAELKREEDLIKLNIDELNINMGLISSLLTKSEEVIESIINQFMEIENVEAVDFKSIISGLIPEIKENVKEENILFLAKIPEQNMGLINELKELIKIYGV